MAAGTAGASRTPVPADDGPGRDLPLRTSDTIQGNILAPFNKPHQEFLFFSFANDRDAGRRWLAELAADGVVATTRSVAEHNDAYRAFLDGAGERPAPRVWVGLSLTSSGLVVVHPELASDLVAFEAFWGGPLGERRVPGGPAGVATTTAELLGDVGTGDPRYWAIGAPFQVPVDALVTVAADAEEDLLAGADEHRARALRAGLRLVEVETRDGGPSPGQRGDKLADGTPDDPAAGREHFGFRDGISQPGVRGFSRACVRNGGWEDAPHAGSRIIAAGEFVLGYPGERAPSRAGSQRPPVPAWMHDGSFQVLRRLTQDVGRWLAQMDALGDDQTPGASLAEKAVGRRRDGSPLAGAGDSGGINDFDYSGDAAGYVTPRFAHIRKTNPRDDARFGDRARRLLRRGIPFGPPYRPGGPVDGTSPERGLLFIAFMASIEDQFEFIQWNWARNLAPATVVPAAATVAGPDPVVGPAGGALLQLAGGQPRTLDFQQFVTTSGAVYAFTPSLSTLRRLGQPESMHRD